MLEIKDTENWFHHSLVIVDEVKRLFIFLLEFYLRKQGKLGITLPQFISNNKHIIIHLYESKKPCCLCKSSPLKRKNNHTVLRKPQMDILLEVSSGLACGGCTKYCCYDVNQNLQSKHLDSTLSSALIINCTDIALENTAERKALEFLRDKRNKDFAHTTKGRMSDEEFQNSMNEMEMKMLYLATFCGEEEDIKQSLYNIRQKPFSIDKYNSLKDILQEQTEHNTAILQKQEDHESEISLLKNCLKAQDRKTKEIIGMMQLQIDEVKAICVTNSSISKSDMPSQERDKLSSKTSYAATRDALCKIDSDYADLDENQIELTMQDKQKRNEKYRFSIKCCRQQCIILELKYTPEILSSADNLRLAIRTLLNDFIEAGGIDTSIPGEIRMSFSFQGVLNEDEVSVLQSVFSEPHTTVGHQTTLDEQREDGSKKYIGNIVSAEENKIHSYDEVSVLQPVLSEPHTKIEVHKVDASCDVPAEAGSQACAGDVVSNEEFHSKGMDRNKVTCTNCYTELSCNPCAQKSELIDCLRNEIDLLKEDLEKIKDGTKTVGTTDDFKALVMLDLKRIFALACKSGNIHMVDLLLHTFDPSQINADYAFYEVCISGKVDMVELILNKLNHMLLDVNKAFIVSCQSGLLQIVQLLLEKLDHTSLDLNKALGIALDCSYIDMVKLILEKVDINMLDLNEISVKACGSDYEYIISLLLNKGESRLLDFQKVLTVAYKAGNKLIVGLLLIKIDHSLFDFKAILHDSSKFHDVPTLKVMLETVDHSRLDVNQLMITACHSGQAEVVDLILDKVDHDTLDLKSAMNVTYRHNKGEECAKLLLKRFPHTKLGSKTTLITACRMGNEELVKQIIVEVDHRELDLKAVMSIACTKGNEHIVRLLIGTIDPNLLGCSRAMSDAVRNDREQIVKLLLEKFDYSMFDLTTETTNQMDILKVDFEKVDHNVLNIKTLFNNACEYGSFKTIQILLEIIDPSVFNFKTVLAEIFHHIRSREMFSMQTFSKQDVNRYIKIAMVFLDTKVHSLFDLKLAFIEACRYNGEELVGLLWEKIDHSLLDLEAGVITACQFDNKSTLMFLLKLSDSQSFNFKTTSKNQKEKVSHSKLNLKTAMNEACSFGSETIVRFLLDNVDESMFDLRAAMNEACARRFNLFATGEIDERFVENLSHDISDLKTTMIRANKSVNGFEINKMLGDINNSIRKVIIALNEAYRVYHFGKEKIVELFVEKFSPMLDFKMAMNEACKSGCEWIVRFLLENVDHSMFDFKSAMSEACVCKSGQVEAHLKELSNSMFNLQGTVTEVGSHKDMQEFECINNRLGQILDVINKVHTFHHSGRMQTIKLFVTNVSHSMLDLQTAMNMACEFGNDEIVKILLENVDHTNFDLKLAMRAACVGKLDPFKREQIVTLLVEQFYHSM